jgi:hypothetical protein
MRTSLAALVVLLATGLGAVFQSQPVNHCRLAVECVDAATGKPLPAVLRIRRADGEAVRLDELVHRGQGLTQPKEILTWWVMPGPTTIGVPAGPISVQAFSGLETALVQQQIDLSGKVRAALRIELTRFADARRSGYVAGNTHLHLQKISRQQSDRYLQEVPLADGLDIVYVSYLERALADLEYTTNKYTPAELRKLSSQHVHFGHGQEHRHNFGPGGEGYGHILLLEIPYIIRPVSIGPGITLAGHDAPPLQQGIDEARHNGGTVVWAHNMFGFEDVPNWLTGRVHANNIFDGGTHGSYKETFYRYLNVGLNVPFSTGTDWFIYDFSRVYVMTDKAISPREWLQLLSEGKSYITNGPLLEFTVDGQPLGSTIEVSQPRRLNLAGKAVGRVDFGRLEIIRNGRRIGTATSRKVGQHFACEFSLDVHVGEPTWFALRTPPPPVPGDPELQEPVPRNEYGGPLFAHTSPIYVRYGGKGCFDRGIAEKLVADMQANMESITKRGHFADDQERDRVLAVYRAGIETLTKQLDQQ